MEKLILKCGRYLPPAAGDSESRIRSLEGYLSELTGELEFLVEELDRVLTALESAVTEGVGQAAVALSADRKEEAYEQAV